MLRNRKLAPQPRRCSSPWVGSTSGWPHQALGQPLPRPARRSPGADRGPRQWLSCPARQRRLALAAASLLEIFSGSASPPRPSTFFFFFFLPASAEREAVPLSAALAELLSGGRPWRSSAIKIPGGLSRRRNPSAANDSAAVMAGQRRYSSGELDSELLDLHRTLPRAGRGWALRSSASIKFPRRCCDTKPPQKQAGSRELAEVIPSELAAAELQPVKRATRNAPASPSHWSRRCACSGEIEFEPAQP